MASCQARRALLLDEALQQHGGVRRTQLARRGMPAKARRAPQRLIGRQVVGAKIAQQQAG
jgi:hypothetical protein